MTAVGPAGPMQTGYSLNLGCIEVLGSQFQSLKIAAYDIDTTLGFSVDGLTGLRSHQAISS